MYSKAFYINEAVGNNAFSWERRTHRKLFVPGLKKIESFAEIELGKEVCFEDYDFDGVLQSCKGLDHIYECEWKGKKLFLFDNHNHAYYFWYLARSQ